MTQEEAYSYFFPEIRDNGQEYYKTCLIYAYPATLNQYIETWTADGLETTNYAKKGWAIKIGQKDNEGSQSRTSSGQ